MLIMHSNARYGLVSISQRLRNVRDYYTNVLKMESLKADIEVSAERRHKDCVVCAVDKTKETHFPSDDLSF